jgi:hypothetical protein
MSPIFPGHQDVQRWKRRQFLRHGGGLLQILWPDSAVATALGWPPVMGKSPGKMSVFMGK